jgi:hypothetical protein
MKKIFALLLLALFALPTVAQTEQKGVRFGIRISPAFNWLSSESEKKIKPDGATLKMGIGLVTEFRITDVASFQTGIEYTGVGGKVDYKGTDTAFYYFLDDQIVEAEINGDTITNPSFSNTALSRNILGKRKYNVGYLNIPLTIKLKTKDIGGFTYFGQIGGNLQFRLSGRANDDVKSFSFTNINGAEQTNEKIDIVKQVNLFNAAASVGGGAEYNISGTTSLYASIHYQHSFINFTKDDTNYLLREKVNTNGKFEPFPNTLKLRQFVIAIGVLF